MSSGTDRREGRFGLFGRRDGSGRRAGRAGPVRTFLAVAGLELRRWRRERVAVASALVLPVAMAALVSLALGGEMVTPTMTFAVVDLDGGPVADAFVEQGLGHPSVASLVEVRPVDSRSAAQRLLDSDEVDLVLVLPNDLSEETVAGRPSAIEVLGDHPVARDLALLVEGQVITQVRARAIATARTGSAPTSGWPLSVSVGAPSGQPLDAARHYGPGIGMFFVLVTLGFAAQRMVGDRQQGVGDRLDAAPVTPGMVLAGRVAAGLVVGGLSLTTTAVAMGVLFGHGWGPLLPVVALIGAVVLALGGVAALVAAHARTPEQTQTLVVGVSFVFALAGGTFAPPGTAGSRSGLAGLVPTTYALDGFAVLSTEGAGLGAIAGVLAALVAFAMVGAAGAGLSHRRWGWR